MKKDSIRKRVKGLIGKYLLPETTPIKVLDLELPDLLIFKEWLDIHFGDIFEIEKLSDCSTIQELTDYITNTVLKKKDSMPSVAFKTSNELPEDLGFLIADLSVNDTVSVQWDKLPANTQKTFLKVINSGIDKTKAEIRERENQLFIFSFFDLRADFSAVYIIYQDKVIFNYEN